MSTNYADNFEYKYDDELESEDEELESEDEVEEHQHKQAITRAQRIEYFGDPNSND